MRLIRKSELKGVFGLIGVAFILLLALLALNGTLTDRFGIRFTSQKPITGKIVFVSDRNGHSAVWSMNPDGSDQKPLGKSTFSDTEPVISPDGFMLAFVSQRAEGHNQVFGMDPDGSHQHRLSNVSGSKSSPMFSHDSKEISFLCSGEIWRMGWRGDGIDRVLPTEQQSAMERMNEERDPYIWSAASFDGKLVAGIRSSRDNQVIQVMKPDDKMPSPIGQQVGGTTAPIDGELLSAAWSPDQPKLVVAIELDNGKAVLVVADIEDQTVNPITRWSPPMGNPQWSPDGSSIVVEMQKRNGPRDYSSVGLLLADPYGGQPHPLVKGEANNPKWSPDSKTIVFTRGKDICVVDVESGKVTNLTKGKGTNTSPCWAPDVKTKTK